MNARPGFILAALLLAASVSAQTQVKPRRTS